MRNIVELRQKRAKAVADARAILEQAEKRDDYNGELSTEEQEKWDRAFGEANRLKDEVARLETLLEEERALAASADADPPRPGAGDGDGDQRSGDAGPVDRRATPEYRAAFRSFLASGMRGLGPVELRAIQLDDDVSAGYMVADEQFRSEMIQALDDFVFIRALATQLPLTNAKSLGAPSLDTDISDADWTGEIVAVSEDTSLALGKRELTPHMLSKLAKVSMQLARASAGGAVTFVQNRLVYKFGVTQEKAFLSGTGAGQPLGVFTASDDGISTGRDLSTDNTTTTIAADNLKRQKYNIKAPYRRNARWLFHRDGVGQIARLKDGNGQYLWAESVRVGEPDRLLNHPVMESEYAPSTFTTGLYVGLFGDFSYYWIVDAAGFSVQRLDELYAATNQIGFIGRFESDGMPVLEEAFSRIKLA